MVQAAVAGQIGRYYPGARKLRLKGCRKFAPMARFAHQAAQKDPRSHALGFQYQRATAAR